MSEIKTRNWHFNFELVWVAADGQARMSMGTYVSEHAARAAIPAAKADALRQCADDEERAGIEAGTWIIAE